MAEYDVQIRISTELEKSFDSISSLSKMFGTLSTRIKEASASLFAFGKQDIAAGFNKAGTAVSEFGQGLDRAGKQMKKFGRDLTANVAAPLIALAGLSLKKVFDDAISGNGTRQTQEFAGAVQALKKEFDAFIVTVGTQLAPVATRIVNALNSLLQVYKNLSPETKAIVLNIGLFAAALGPAVLALSSMVGVVSNLLKVIGPLITYLPRIVSVFTSWPVAIAAIVGSIAGLVNVFLKLRAAGTDTGQAIMDTLELAAGFVNKYVTGTILKGIAAIMGGVGKLTSYVNEAAGKAIEDGGKILGGVAAGFDKEFDAAKGNIDKKLEASGSSAGAAFSFGLFGTVQKKIDEEPIKFTLSPDVQRMLIETRDAFRQVQALKAQNDLEQQRLEALHQVKMQELSSGGTNGVGILQARLDQERSFLLQKQALDTQEIEAERSKALALAQIETDKAKRTQAIAAAENKYKIDSAKLSSTQQLELTKQTLAEEEALYVKRKEVLEQYTGPAAQGLTDGLLAFAEGTKTAEQAFSDFARSFIREITQMILKQQLLNALNGFFGGSSGAPSSGGGGANFGSFPIPGKASGGLITGPGTGTSDSILHRLSNGEYVNDAKTVKTFGANFFAGLKAMAHGGARTKSNFPAFAEGGLVGSSSSAPQVIIQNTGTPQQVESTSFDPATQVTKVVLADFQKNGPISKSMKNTFGTNRGGFR